MAAIAPVDQLALPPGFRFHPTDEELVNHYLRRKVLGVGGLHPQLDFIPGVDDLCKFEPWELPERSFSPSRDDPGAKAEWYFFSSRGRKYPNGLRMKRGTRAGFWKSTGKDRRVLHHHVAIGMKKTLVYHLGRAPHGKGTGWIMHEYRLHHHHSHIQNTYALCRVFNKYMVNPSPDVAGGTDAEKDVVPFVLGSTDTDQSVTLSVPSGADVEKEVMHLQSSGPDTDEGGMRSMTSRVDVDNDVVQFVPGGAHANKDETWMEFICNDDYWKQFISEDTSYSATS